MGFEPITFPFAEGAHPHVLPARAAATLAAFSQAYGIIGFSSLIRLCFCLLVSNYRVRFCNSVAAWSWRFQPVGFCCCEGVILPGEILPFCVFITVVTVVLQNVMLVAHFRFLRSPNRLGIYVSLFSLWHQPQLTALVAHQQTHIYTVTVLTFHFLCRTKWTDTTLGLHTDLLGRGAVLKIPSRMFRSNYRKFKQFFVRHDLSSLPVFFLARPPSPCYTCREGGDKMDDVKLMAFPKNEVDALTMLYVQSQDLSALTPEQLFDLYCSVHSKIEAQNNAKRDKKNQLISY